MEKKNEMKREAHKAQNRASEASEYVGDKLHEGIQKVKDTTK